MFLGNCFIVNVQWVIKINIQKLGKKKKVSLSGFFNLKIKLGKNVGFYILIYLGVWGWFN